MFSSNITTLLLIRHGETAWNKQGIKNGHSDIPLNKVGKKQADMVAGKMIHQYPEIEAIYASDLLRASETAKKIAFRYGLDVKEMSSLRERNFGAAEGMNPHEIKKNMEPLLINST